MNFQVGDRVMYVLQSVWTFGPRYGATGVVVGYEVPTLVTVRFDDEFKSRLLNSRHEWLCRADWIQHIWIQETDDLEIFDVDAVL